MLYAYAAIVRKDLGADKYSQQLQQGWFHCEGNEDEALGFSYRYLGDKNPGCILESVIVMEIKEEDNG